MRTGFGFCELVVHESTSEKTELITDGYTADHLDVIWRVLGWQARATLNNNCVVDQTELKGLFNEVSGLGRFSIRRRVQDCDGTMGLEVKSDRGFEILMRIPLPDEDVQTPEHLAAARLITRAFTHRRKIRGLTSEMSARVQSVNGGLRSPRP